ncbi:MAG TPA: tetratricopeptide repeat protein, partial [Syntrophales bacterium]|nr:tetratricopeptide repeat protein [Syntrophales bacterium]
MFFLAVILLLLFFPFHSVPAQDVSPAERQFAFAESLFEEKDYFRAITEYKRFLFLYPEDEGRVELSRFRIGECYMRAERWEEAVASFNFFLRHYPESPRVDEALLFRGT